MTGSEFNKESLGSMMLPSFLPHQSLSHVPPPPGLTRGEKTLSQDFQSLVQQDEMLKTLMSQAARSTLANQDPCTIPDDLREELMRQKRKDDAFKTALCDAYKRNQTCSYGDQCRFAHGVHELRLPQNPRGRNHPKYKTVLCDKFSTTGNCKYGTRCQFIHKLVNTSVVAQASGVLNNTCSSGTSAAAFNQSLYVPGVQSDMSIDANQSLPFRREDISRALVRASHMDTFNDNVNRLSRVIENQFHRDFPFIGLRK
uniref:Zinc finger protein n=1 Tax=Caenorhabditis tropicalis TaxID=1561998 RepID=A0A1I7V4G3_9PELO